MTDTDDLPEPDRVPGAPHPRHSPDLFGQSAAQTAFLDAFGGGRLHHAWLLTGPQGVGKATLAWRIARFLLATPDPGGDGLFGADTIPDTLQLSPDHPVSRRVAALSDPGLFLLRRGGAGSSANERDKARREGRFSAVIRVDEIRELRGFFALSAADGGRRVVIVDAADELNVQAANALLKMLEEPPARTVLLLVAHQPSRLLPTIRSRCRTLRLGPLGPDDMARALTQAGADLAPDTAPALAELSGGSVGAALSLIDGGGLDIYATVLALMASLPALDRPRLLALADSCAGKGREARLDLLLSLTDRAMARAARQGVVGPPTAEIVPGEAETLARLAPDPRAARGWATRAQELGERARHARAVNVDPAGLVTDLFLQMR